MATLGGARSTAGKPAPSPIASEVLDLLVRINSEGSNADGLDALGAALPALLPDEASADAVFHALVDCPPEQLGTQDLSVFACVVRGMSAPEGKKQQAFVAAVRSLPEERRVAVLETLRDGVTRGSTGLDESPGMMTWLRQGVRQVVEEADAELAGTLAAGHGAGAMPEDSSAAVPSGLPKKPHADRSCRECSGSDCIIA